jgi:hypothetical protein
MRQRAASRRKRAEVRLWIALSVKDFGVIFASEKLGARSRTSAAVALPGVDKGAAELVQPHIRDLSTSTSQPGANGSKPCSSSQRIARRLRNDHHPWITSRSTSVT